MPETLMPTPLFGSMLMGGFECAAHRMRDGRRLDVAASTGHDVRAGEDYRLLHRHGITAARDGLRWHMIEARQGQYDWSTFVSLLRAGRETGTTVIWDLLHYGVPDQVDLFAPQFVDRFAAFAREAARVIAAETDAVPIITPINEVSFWAWAGGETGGLDPFASRRGTTMKRQLVRAVLAASAEMRAIDSRTQIAIAEPLIHVQPADGTATALASAARHNEAQFETLDMLLGRSAPDLGGAETAVDIVGLNHYFDNQWIDGSRTIALGDWRHLPLHTMLTTVAGRYDKPIYLAETGTEGVFRPHWLRYVCDAVFEAAALGVPVGGVCLYPVISHLGWDDDRHCQNGMFDGHAADSHRHVYGPLAREVAIQAARFASAAAPASGTPLRLVGVAAS